MIRSIFIILLSLSLAGCTIFKTEKEVEIVYKTKTVLVKPPENLIQNCEKISPPSKEEYLNFTFDKKENSLTILSLELYSQIDKCNNSINSVRRWIKDQTELLKDKE